MSNTISGVSATTQQYADYYVEVPCKWRLYG